MINERFMVRGKRKDNGEWIQGYLMPVLMPVRGNEYVIMDKCLALGGQIYPSEFKLVDKGSIEPVIMRVIVKELKSAAEYYCPNCNYLLDTIGKDDKKFNGHTDYCGACGQRLDWEGESVE